jgi:uncharacterized protein YdhG (YjbR/CyaY superfamily)
MDQAVTDYIDALAPEQRSLFDRVHQLILAARPDAEVVLSYNMPTYKAAGHRLFVGVWKHGLSLYGWAAGGDGGFGERHPEFVTSKGTIQLRPEDAAAIPDAELSALATAVLNP